MHFKTNHLIVIGIGAILITACTSVLYMPTMTDSKRTGVSTDTLMLGRNLYVNTCSSCHGLYSPEQRSKAKWEKILPAMQKKAKCSDKDLALIKQYIFAGIQVKK
jgi:cytochrome c5